MGGVDSLRTPGPNRPACERLTVFCALWAAANFFHLLWFPFGPRNGSFWIVALGIATVAVLFRPSSTRRFVVMLACSVGHTISVMPRMPNHYLLQLVIDAGMLAALATHRIRRRRAGTPEEMLDAIAPVARGALILLYGAAVLHKLNWDFLDPAVSSASTMLDQTTLSWGLPPAPAWLAMLAIVGTLVLEIVIPVMLVVRRTRALGVFVGAVFHLALSLHPIGAIYSFSALVFAIYYLFLPPAFTVAAAGRTRRLLRALHMDRWRRGPVIAAVVALLVAGLTAVPRRAIPEIGFWAWVASAAVLAWLAIPALLATRRAPDDRPLLRQSWPGRVALALLLFNALNPYLGLKTQTSFSMFSNLRTEDRRTNHLFMPTWLQLGTLQVPMVEILESSDPALDWHAKAGVLIARFELKQLVSRNHADLFVRYRIAGEEMTFRRRGGRCSDPALATPSPWILRKLLWFRPVERDGPVTCRH